MSVSTVKPHECERSSHNEKNDKDASRKRGRDSKRSCEGDSAAQMGRLLNKRRKSLDSDLNISDCSISAVDSTAQMLNCSHVEMEDKSIIHIPSSAVEISYEEFLTGTGIAHIDTSLCDSEDADADVIMSPVNTPLKHGELADEQLIKSLEKNENAVDEDECEGDLNSSEVASKDIRSFFSKCSKVTTQPISAATFMKIKVDIHSQHSMSSKSKCNEGHTKAGSDLARRQRAAIVITDDDLDIEVIDVSQNDDDFEIEFLDNNIVDRATSESNAGNKAFSSKLESTSLMCNEISLDTDDRTQSSVECNSVSVKTSTLVAKAVDNRRKLRLRTAKLEEENAKVDAQVFEKAILCNQVVDCDHDEVDLRKDKCSDKVILVDEKEEKVECDVSLTTESTDAFQQCDLTLVSESRKQKQVSCFNIVCSCVN